MSTPEGTPESTADGAAHNESTQLAKTLDELRKQIRRTNQEIRSLRRDVTRLSDYVGEQQQRQFQQIEALAGLYHAVRPRHPFPPTRSWAASPDLLAFLYRTVRAGGISRVLECGSGVSTLIMAYALQHRGTGRVDALEHDEEYVRSTRDLLREHELEAWAEVRHAPLQPVDLDGQTWPWYDTTAVPPESYDLIFVDGPPGGTREQARFPAVPLLLDRLADDGLIVLDDHARADETQIARRWLELHPELSARTLPHEKGTLLLRRRDAATAT